MATGRKRKFAAGKLLLAAAVLMSVLSVYPGGSPGFPAAHAAAQGTETYEWGSVPIGGGGYVTGIVLHPAEQDLAYIRTDVGGIFRWNEQDKSWKQLIGFANRNETNLYGGESIALDPSDPDVIYAALGKHEYWSPSDIYKSSDRGETWTATGLRHNGNYVRMAGNGNQRSAGERLAVDPNNSDVVYFGSRYDGLFRSASGAAVGSWERVNSLSPSGEPVNGAPVGVSFVLFDPRSGVLDGKTRTIYAGFFYYGVYVSHDAGATWSLIPGSPIRPIRAALDSDSDNLYVTHYEGIAKLRPDQAEAGWEDITPAPEAATETSPGQPFSGFAIDPRDDDVLIAARRQDAHANPIYRSTDGGATWSELAFAKNGLVPWTPDWHWSSATSSIAIDPFQPDRVWFTDWYYAWRTEDIAPADASPPEFRNYANGLETVVNVSNLASPPEGRNILHTGIADNGGFDHSSLENFPQSTYFTGTAGLHELTTTGIDVQEFNSDFVVRVGTYGWNGDGRENPGNGGYSEDGGVTYSAFPSLPYDKAQGGRVAVSAADADRIVWMPQRGGVYYTPDRGATWLPSAGVPAGLLSGDHIFANYYNPLAADRVNGDQFYVYDKAGKFYRSSDGGQSWQHVSDLPPQSTAWHTVQAAPGIMGEVWVSLNESGLYRSDNAGSSFEKVQGVEEAFLFSFGKNAPGRLNPAVFVYGKIAGFAGEGVFRSDDMGASWVRINVDNPFPGNDPNAMTGDRQVHGRVYIGTNGSGIRYGALTEPLEAPDYSDDSIPPTAPLNVNAVSVHPNRIVLSWEASSDIGHGVMGYRIYRDGAPAAETYGTSYSVSGLSPGTDYSFQVRAMDYAGNLSDASEAVQATTPAADTEAPAAPAGLRAEKASSVNVRLTWQANEETDVAGYYVHRGSDPDFVPGLSSRLGLTAVNYYNDGSVEADRRYYYKLQAIDGNGNLSEASEAIEVLTVVLKPTEVIVDNLDSGFASDSHWAASTYSASRYGANYFHNEMRPDRWAKWTPYLTEAGIYNVYMLWNASEDRADHVPVSIVYKDGTADTAINQRQSDNQWVWLGSYEFAPGSAGYVLLTTQGTDITIADAVKFTLDSSDPYGSTHPATAEPAGAPVIELDRQDGTTNAAAVELSGAIGKQATLEVSHNGQPLDTPYADNYTSVFRIQLELTEGDNTVVVTAKDRQGQTANATWSIRYDVPGEEEPDPDPVDPDPVDPDPVDPDPVDPDPVDPDPVDPDPVDPDPVDPGPVDPDPVDPDPVDPGPVDPDPVDPDPADPDPADPDPTPQVPWTPPASPALPGATVIEGAIRLQSTPVNGAVRAELKPEQLREGVAGAKGNAVVIYGPEGELERLTAVLPALPLYGDGGGRIQWLTLDAGFARVALPARYMDWIAGSDTERIELTVAKTQETPGASGIAVTLLLDGKPADRLPDGAGFLAEIPYALEEGQQPGRVIVYRHDKGGEAAPVANGKYGQAQGAAVFRFAEPGVFSVAYAARQFRDLGEAGWAEEGIEALAARGAVPGDADNVDNGEFRPREAVTRGQFLELLLRAFGAVEEEAAGSWTDVAANHPHYNAIASAQKLGIVNGRGDGRFGADDVLAREDMMVLLHRFALASGVALPSAGDFALSPFVDGDAVSGYAADAVLALRESGLVNGAGGGRLLPQAPATRAEAAALVYRLFSLEQPAWDE